MKNFWTFAPFSFALTLLVSGCDAPKKSTTGVQAREIIGKKTQNVLKLDEELKKGAKLAPTTVTSTDYLGAIGDTYKTVVPNLTIAEVDRMMQIYEIQNNKFPQNYDEFMTEIIKKDKPDGFMLPLLPYYMEYAYDEATKKLVVVEYPEKKTQFQKEQDKKLGR